MSAKTDVEQRLVEVLGSLHVYLEEVDIGSIWGTSYRHILLLVADIPGMGLAFKLNDLTKYGEQSPSNIDGVGRMTDNYSRNLTLSASGWRPCSEGWEPPATLKRGDYVLHPELARKVDFNYYGPPTPTIIDEAA